MLRCAKAGDHQQGRWQRSLKALTFWQYAHNLVPVPPLQDSHYHSSERSFSEASLLLHPLPRYKGSTESHIFKTETFLRQQESLVSLHPAEISESSALNSGLIPEAESREHL